MSWLPAGGADLAILNSRTSPDARKIYRQATDEDGSRRDENSKIDSIFLSITS
jgi:hypothetical protein